MTIKKQVTIQKTSDNQKTSSHEGRSYEHECLNYESVDGAWEHIYMCVCFLRIRIFRYITERKNGVILTQKVESLVELKFDPGFRDIGEYLSQIHSQYRVHLTPIFFNYSESLVEL